MVNHKLILFSPVLLITILFACSIHAAGEIDKIIKAAEQGHVSAQLNLGYMYARGEGVSEDNIEAARWFRMAAEQGHAEAQVVLGLIYADGEGVPEDDAEAVRWYRMAAEQGNITAQYKLGYMYVAGEGVPVDLVQAYAWISMAAAQSPGSLPKVTKKTIAEGMTRAEIAEAQKLSREFWKAYGPGQASQ